MIRIPFHTLFLRNGIKSEQLITEPSNTFNLPQIRLSILKGLLRKKCIFRPPHMSLSFKWDQTPIASVMDEFGVQVPRFNERVRFRCLIASPITLSKKGKTNAPPMFVFFPQAYSDRLTNEVTELLPHWTLHTMLWYIWWRGGWFEWTTGFFFKCIMEK